LALFARTDGRTNCFETGFIAFAPSEAAAGNTSQRRLDDFCKLEEICAGNRFQLAQWGMCRPELTIISGIAQASSWRLVGHLITIGFAAGKTAAATGQHGGGRQEFSILKADRLRTAGFATWLAWAIARVMALPQP
jgi:hypothetical protein